MEEKKSGIKKFFEEFKAFAMRGNVLDMAVGVVVGGAFTAIVTSLNQDILTPILGIFGGTDFFQSENHTRTWRECAGSVLWKLYHRSPELPDHGIRDLLPGQSDQYDQREADPEARGRRGSTDHKDLSVLQERDRYRGSQMPALYIHSGR